MITFRALFPVCTADGRLLFPAGAAFSSDLLEKSVQLKGSRSPKKLYPFLQHGSVKKDLLDCMSQPPYPGIFGGRKKSAELLSVMGHIRTVEPILQSLEYFKQKDKETYRHVLVVSALSTLLVPFFFPDHERLIQESSATCPTHDIGKTCVPLYILKKVTPLTHKERTILKQHTIAGYALLSHYIGDGTISAIVARDHHEKRNGGGYPRGIALRDRMVEIIMGCDVYDALVSPRPYRAVPYDNRTALEELTQMANRGDIGWDVVKALVAINRKSKPHYAECVVSQNKRGTPPEKNSYGITAEERDEDTDSSNDVSAK